MYMYINTYTHTPYQVLPSEARVRPSQSIRGSTIFCSTGPCAGRTRFLTLDSTSSQQMPAGLEVFPHATLRSAPPKTEMSPRWDSGSAAANRASKDLRFLGSRRIRLASI